MREEVGVQNEREGLSPLCFEIGCFRLAIVDNFGSSLKMYWNNDLKYDKSYILFLERK